MTQPGNTDVNDVHIEEGESASPLIPMPIGGELAWLLFGSGVLVLTINLLRERRGLVDLVVPIGLIGTGVAVLLQRRQDDMDAAQRKILAELDALDPVARAQVLKAVAKDELNRIPGIGPTTR